MLFHGEGGNVSIHHSPAPWSYDDESGLIVARGGKYVATVEPDSRPDGPERANALLLAASPRLYRSLKRLEEIYGYDSDNPYLRGDWIEVRDALAAAEGKR